MTPQQFNELNRQADVIERDKQDKQIDDIWKEIEEEYLKDEFPIFGGPFTDALTIWEWLRRNYNPPTLRKKIKL